MIKAIHLSKEFTKTILEEPDKKRKSLFSVNNKKTSKKVEFKAVDDISLEAKKGEIIGILGPNGAGKTTLLRMLGTLMEPTSGEVVICNKEGVQETDAVLAKTNIGYLSGNTKLYHRMSTREMLEMLGEVYNMDKMKCKERIDEIFHVLDMEGFADNRIEKLSTGQTQRANIARCLIHDPDIYIFDEPTLGLDIISADAIVSFMKKQKELGKTVLYSTHYLEEAQFLCDEIYMIYKGRVVKKGSPEEILRETESKQLRDAFHIIMNQFDDEGEL